MRKVISMALAVILLASLSVVSFSAAVEKSGETGSSQVELTYGTLDESGTPTGGANFKVTVPTKLPFYVDSEGNVTTATDAKIVNEGNGQVDVKGVSAETVNGWEIVDSSTDFKTVPVDSKKFTMSILGDIFPAGTSTSTIASLGAGWTTINGQDSLALSYDGDFAVQSTALTDNHIANVIFTVGWHTA